MPPVRTWSTRASGSPPKCCSLSSGRVPRHPAATTPASLARPIVAAVAVDVARIERALAIAHGARGDARVAFERLLADAAPDISTVALEDLTPVASVPRRTVTANLWGRLVQMPADDADVPSDRSIFTRTTDPMAGHPHPAIVELTFDRGLPTAINQIPMRFPELVEVLDTIAGDHGVGRADRTRRSGMRVEREIGESPAAVTLAAALDELERTGLDARLLTLKTSLVPQYAALATTVAGGLPLVAPSTRSTTPPCPALAAPFG